MTARPALPNSRSSRKSSIPEMQFRRCRRAPRCSSAGCCLTLSTFHYYTAGFGLLRETTHRGIHIAFVLGLIFLVFSGRKSDGRTVARRRRCCGRAASR